MNILFLAKSDLSQARYQNNDHSSVHFTLLKGMEIPCLQSWKRIGFVFIVFFLLFYRDTALFFINSRAFFSIFLNAFSSLTLITIL